MAIAGKLYLLHFSRPLHHARHYLGYTGADDVQARIDRHIAGRGSPLLRAVIAAGIDVTLAMSMDGTRDDERRIKKRKNLARMCPTCAQERAQGKRRPRPVRPVRPAKPAADTEPIPF